MNFWETGRVGMRAWQDFAQRTERIQGVARSRFPDIQMNLLRRSDLGGP